MKGLEPNNLGKKYIESYPKITIKKLYKIIEEKVKEELLQVELNGIELIRTKANYGGCRVWFKCPICKSKVFTLYDKDSFLQCRLCTGLKYKKQRYKGMVEEKVYKNK